MKLIVYLKMLGMTACLLSGVLVIKAQENHNITLNLNRTIELARTNSPDVVSAKHTFTSAYWNYRSFQADYLPSLVFSAAPNLMRTINPIIQPDGTEKYLEQNVLTLGGDISVRQNIALTGGTFFIESSLQRMELLNDKIASFRTAPINIGYSQKLFGYNGLKWNKKIEPLRYEEAKKNYVTALENVSLNAARYFFSLANAQSNYEIACFNYANADTLFQRAKRRYEIGTITESEFLQLEVRLLTESTNKMNALIELDDQRQTLCIFLGLDKDVIIKVEVDKEIPQFQVKPETAFEQFWKNSANLEYFDRALLESESTVASVKSNAGMSADIYLSYGLSQTAPDLEDAYKNPLDQQQVRLGISLPILDWGKSKGRVKVAKSRHELLKMQIEQQKNDLEMSLRKQVLQFNLQAERVNIEAKKDITAQKSYMVSQKLYLMGEVTLLDLNTSIVEKDNARRSYINALSTFWSLYYTLRKNTLYDFEKNLPITEDYRELFR